MADGDHYWVKYAPQQWRNAVAPKVLEVLLQCARDGKTLTYTELAHELNRRFSLVEMPIKALYGQAIGAVGFALRDLGEEWGEMIPPINILVVGQASRLPGDGADYFLEQWLGKSKIRKVERAELMRLAMKRVWQYPHWTRVARHFGISAIPQSLHNKAKRRPTALRKSPRECGEPESEAHKALKNFTAGFAVWFKDFGNFSRGETDTLLQSGDRLDVLFSDGYTDLAVAVKTNDASDAELRRGIFQCVKYREVLRATQLADERIPNAQAVLVSTRSPDIETRRLLELLRVKFVLAPPEADQRPRISF